MRKLLLPLLLGLFGAGAGIGAGIMLPKAEPAETADACLPAPDAPSESAAALPAAVEDAGSYEYMKMNNQFVVPVVADGKVSALVVISLSLEVVPGAKDGIFAREPKLRDAFLQVLFDHANTGGFRGAFTNSSNMDVLREALRDVARLAVGPDVHDVLVTDIVRQDV